MRTPRNSDRLRLPVKVRLRSVKSVNPKDPLTTSRNDFGFETDISYKNGLPYPVTIILRSGLAVTVPPLVDNWREHTALTIYVRYRFARNVKIDTHRILDDVSDKSPIEMIALRDAIASAKANVTINANECVIHYQVSKQELQSNSGAVYIEALDCSVTSESAECATTTIHPYSEEGKAYTKQRENDKHGFHLKLTINDNKALFGERFINVLGVVYRVKTTNDNTKPDGVYLYSSGSVDNEEGELYYDFASADAELMLFPTANDAQTLGDLEESRKKAYAEVKHQQQLELLEKDKEHKERLNELEKQSMGYREVKLAQDAEHAHAMSAVKLQELELKREHAERMARLQVLEAEHAKAKADRDAYMHREKDYYEHRSYQRKDSSEIIKWAPAFVVGVGLVLSKFI